MFFGLPISVEFLTIKLLLKWLYDDDFGENDNYDEDISDEYILYYDYGVMMIEMNNIMIVMMIIMVIMMLINLFNAQLG